MPEQNTALIVIDMQADYIGEKSKNHNYPNALIDRINERIAAVQQPGNLIVYVKNVGRLNKEAYVSDFVQGLSVVSNSIVLKEKASIFCNAELLKLLTQNHISRLEIVGIDGNCCVAASAIDAAKLDYTVVLPLKYIGIKSEERFAKTREKLIKANVAIIA